MKDPWIENEWDDLCERLQECAADMDSTADDEVTSRQEAASEFVSSDPPTRYPELLQRVAEAAGLAISWQSTS
ncbi:hypothetical protein [Allorhodopirellula solitaria]|uniref:Uncharacterized protein n=1 Tax=Allorhodopirellula solitaria TaxID=2527987 RepID=A0A5C5YF33_9BACT|nr:hypothetical protein [Allorhodopirellula solitaria]TWT74336.1 hypothetical protein CA85_12240 [Allorhodopirellula solitaria]